MTKLTDGKSYVELYMGYWLDDHYTPSFSDDFFEVAGLPLDEYGFRIVDDVDYCISQMDDWCNGRGDYYGDEDTDEHFDDRVIGISNISKEDLTA